MSEEIFTFPSARTITSSPQSFIDDGWKVGQTIRWVIEPFVILGVAYHRREEIETKYVLRRWDHLMRKQKKRLRLHGVITSITEDTLTVEK